MGKAIASTLADHTASTGGRDLAPEEFKIFRQFLSDACGIMLGDSKGYLVKSRMAGVLKEMEFASLSDLIRSLQKNALPPKVKARLIEAMTTNETFWFRDNGQFDELKNTLLPKLMKHKEGRLKIWSAACSTGQEPYSISICVEECGRSLMSHQVQILGTDISSAVLEIAKRGVYTDLALSRGLDATLKAHYFQACQEGWKLKDGPRQRVRFQPFNLLNPFPVLGKFDVIFCRNVLIYFSEALKRDILSRLAGALHEGGYLFLSSAESMLPSVPFFEPVPHRPIRYYRLKSRVS